MTTTLAPPCAGDADRCQCPECTAARRAYAQSAEWDRLRQDADRAEQDRLGPAVYWQREEAAAANAGRIKLALWQHAVGEAMAADTANPDGADETLDKLRAFARRWNLS